MARDLAEQERAFVDALAADTGRDLGAWMDAIAQSGHTARNDIIDWLRLQGFAFSNASWLERIHHNRGRLIYAPEETRASSAERPLLRRGPALDQAPTNAASTLTTAVATSPASASAAAVSAREEAPAAFTPANDAHPARPAAIVASRASSPVEAAAPLPAPAPLTAPPREVPAIEHTGPEKETETSRDTGIAPPSPTTGVQPTPPHPPAAAASPVPRPAALSPSPALSPPAETPVAAPAAAQPATEAEVALLLSAAKGLRPLAELILREIETLVPGTQRVAAAPLLSLESPMAFAALLPAAKEIRLFADFGAATRDRTRKADPKGRLPAPFPDVLVLNDARQIDDRFRDLVATAYTRALK